MNLNLQTIPCDAEQLESFLAGDLSEIQEREFTLHLSSCENCRRSLQERAAEPEAWQEAEKLLRPAEFELETESRSQSQPLQIQNVLAALGPTDDPAMLGRLGGYEVSGVVGAGGMGVVLKAIDKSLDRTVAIKVLAPHLATSGAARKRFAREAKAAAAVLHPNVIAIHSVSNDESLPYLVMPYVRGTSLQKRLDKEGPLSLHEILRIGSQIAAGLAAAHAQGLVHRDIKPANILLEEGVERVTITDFGLARAVDDASITHSGTIAGTPQYMSPEQARGEAVDGRSDLFSLGSVLYAICTGRAPFRGESSYGVLRLITDEEPRPIREINPDIPVWLCSIIARLMSKQAEGRFASAAEVTQLLEKCLAHVQQPDSAQLPPFLVPSSKKSLFFSISRRSLGVIAMIVAMGLGLLGMVLWQASEAPDIAGKWSGEGWGEVKLDKEDDNSYDGTYTDTFGKKAGEIKLKWSLIEQRFNGTWKEGKDRFGKVSIRLAGDEIRGAWTTSKESKIDPGRPQLADLSWQRIELQNPSARGSVHEKAVAKLVFVFFQDKSRRAVPCLVLKAGDKAIVVSASPAQIVLDGTVAAVDRTFLELPGNPPVDVIYDSRSTIELYVCGAPKDLPAVQLQDVAHVAVKDSVVAMGVEDPYPKEATVVAMDSQAKLELRERNITHQFENLIEVDRTFPEGTPLFKSGRLVGLTLLGSRFLGEKAGKSYVVPAKRIVELCERIGQGDAKAAANSATLRVLNANGSRPLLNDLAEASVGFPASGLPKWTSSPNRDGIIPVGDLSPGPHWLYAAQGSGQPAVLKVTLPIAERDMELRLPAARNWTDKEIGVTPSIVIDERDVEFGEIIAIDILNKSKAALQVSEADVELRADFPGPYHESIFILSPGWASEDRQPFPPVTIEPGKTGRLALKWQAWVKSGLWVRRTGAISEPGFPPAEAGRMWLRVRVGQVGFSLISVRAPTQAVEAAKDGASRKASAAALDLLSAETKAILVKEEYQRFEGTWRISLRTIDRAVSLGEFGKDGKHVIKDRQMGDAWISLDPTKTPREIDLTFTSGPDKGKVLRGIYEWVDNAKSGKLLRISVGTNLYQPGDKDARRPKDFEERSAIDFAIWERIIAGHPKSVDSTSKGDELGFSESKEVVLSMNSSKFMLDLDTGKTMDPPASIRPEQEQMDLQTDQVQPYHYPTKLTGRGLVGLEVKSSDWDASAAEVRRALAGKAVEPLKEMDLGPEKNPTYFFKTRDGAIGVLQLLELVEKPKGIRLRYKTMGRQSERPAQGDNGSRDVEMGVKTDAAHPPSGALRDPVGSTGEVELPKDEAKRIVEQMRGISMQLASRPRSDGKPDPKEERKQEIMDQLRQLGAKAVPALVLALGDSDVQMRRNAELVMIHLAGPYGKPRVDIKEALPALLKATEDPDADVRAWAAHAISEIGPGAKEAVTALIKLLQGKDEGGRNTSCMALGAIGPAAKEALPALRKTLDDPSQDVRKFAQAAINRIELPADAKAAEGQKGIADPNAVAKPNWARQLGTVEGLKSIAYSPDGKLIAAANGNVSFPVAEGWKRAVVILDAETGKTVLSLPLATKEENAILAATEGLPHFEVGPLAFSPDAGLLAVGTGLGQVKLFNPKTGELIRSLDDEPAKLAEKTTPEKLKSLKRAMGGVGSLAFSPDGSLLAITGSSFEDVARNWGDVRRLGRLATGPGRLKVWDVRTGVLKHDLAGHSHAFAAAFSADGSLLVSTGRGLSEGGNDNGVITWNPQTGEKLRSIAIEANGGTHAVVFSPTKKLVAVASRTFDKENDTSSTSIRLVYPLSGITEWGRNFPGWAVPKAFLPDGSGLGVLCGGDSIKFLSVETAADLFEIHPTDAKAKSNWIDFALSPQLRKLAIGGTDKEHIGSVEIWDLGSAGAAKPPAPPLQETEKK